MAKTLAQLMTEHSDSGSCDSSSEAGAANDDADLHDFIEDDDEIDVSPAALFMQLVDSTCIDMLLTGKIMRAAEFVPDTSGTVVDPFAAGPYTTWQRNLSDWEATPEGQRTVDAEGEFVDVIFYRETQSWLRAIDEKLQAAATLRPHDVGFAISVLRRARRWEPATDGSITVDGRLVAMPKEFASHPDLIQHVWLLCNLPYAMKRAAYFWFKDNASRMDGIFVGECLAFIRKNYVVPVGEQLKRDYDAADQWLDGVLGK